MFFYKKKKARDDVMQELREVSKFDVSKFDVSKVRFNFHIYNETSIFQILDNIITSVSKGEFLIRFNLS